MQYLRTFVDEMFHLYNRVQLDTNVITILETAEVEVVWLKQSPQPVY